jgi:hypothetical protein
MQDYRTVYSFDTLCVLYQISGLNRTFQLRSHMEFLMPTLSTPATWLPSLTGWALALGRERDEGSAAFAAGIALKSLSI